MYEKNGEKYFIVDGHLHMWDASPENWVKGAESSTPRGGSSASTPTWASGPPETHWPIEKFMKYSEEDFVKDVFEDGGVDVGIFQSTYLKEWYTTGLQHRRGTTRDGREVPRQADRQRSLGPA